MRESIGATWILGIVLTFIALFSGYLAFSVNYSKAFRMKDGIIERLEKHNGPSQEALNDIDDFMNSIGYGGKGKCSTVIDMNADNLHYGAVLGSTPYNPSQITDNDKFNYCLQKINSTSSNNINSAYYKVYVFFSLSLPVINNSTFFNVTGETGNIHFPEDIVTK